jgi:hypothetical protein
MSVPKCNHASPQTHDFSAIRAAHPLLAFLESRGVRLRRSGNYFVGRCPIHRERNGTSFAVWPAEARWQCFGKCATGGDVVDLLCILEGISIAQAAAQLTGSSSFSVVSLQRLPQLSDVSKATPYDLTPGDCERMRTAAIRLASDKSLITRICQARPEWKPEAVRQVALELQLGYEEGSILFAYHHGIKRRWKDSLGRRRIQWDYGNANRQCWRQELLLSCHRTIFLTEGETDALTLISAGAEDTETSLVLALPSATSYPDPEPFRDRRIVLVPDLDQAGEQCARELYRRLSPIASFVGRANYGV